VSKFLGRDMAVALRWSNFPRSLKLTTHMKPVLYWYILVYSLV